MTIDNSLPTDKGTSPIPTGTGQKPDLWAVAGKEATPLPTRLIRNPANDRARDWGIVAEGQCDGPVDPERDIPWL